MYSSVVQPSLAPYASHPSPERAHARPRTQGDTRGPFERDRDRVLHSTAFRRLQYKTQVFVCHEGDHYRTRLTHSLEVAQIARSLARALCLDEDLAEAIALAHDLGHPPFGHAGEEALDTCMAGQGGFDHNIQSVRVVTKIERRYADFDGLDLTLETLDGLARHNWDLSPAMNERVKELGTDQASYPGLEAQLAALADDIAYNNHDLDDGLRAGLLTIDDLRTLPLVAPIVAQLDERLEKEDDPTRWGHETIRRLVAAMVIDLIQETRARLQKYQPENAAAIRHAPRPLAAFSEKMQAESKELKEFLRKNVYKNSKVEAENNRGHEIVCRLFAYFNDHHDALPDEWAVRAAAREDNKRRRVICDYIAGMTDRYAEMRYDRIAHLSSGIS